LKTVLIVDDNPGHALLTQEAFNEFFEMEEFIYVQNGYEAMDFLNRSGSYTSRGAEHPSLILLDLSMPKFDGYEVLSQIKSSEDFKKIPVIMLSLSDSHHDIDRCYQLGANAYVSKQFDFNRYKTEIKALGEFWGFTNKGPSINTEVEA
jgi:two-component system response regulator